MAPAEANESREHALDSLRAVMMLLGIVLHAAISYGVAPLGEAWPLKDKAVSPVCDLLVALIHSFRMPLFFVLAGFFAALLRDRRGMGGMLRNRAKRILAPFLVGWLVLFPLCVVAFWYAMSAEGVNMEEFAQSRRQDRSGPSTMHLWFLNYLVYFYAITALLDVLGRRLGPGVRTRFSGAFRAVAGNVFGRVGVFGLISSLTLLSMRVGALEQSDEFLPKPASLVAHFVFFGVGWLLYGCRDLLPTFGRLAWTQVALAWLVLAPINLAAEIVQFRALPEHNVTAYLITAFTGGPMVWMLIFGITGLFLRHFNRPVPVMRYLTDSSYWLYLAHLPLVVALTGLLAPVPLPALVKLGLVLAIATSLLLLSYHFAVRPTWVGLWLNGRRYPIRRPPLIVREPAVPQPDPVA
jgi:peptidoglycan/LPS O-acetylase OafA/YrhL